MLQSLSGLSAPNYDSSVPALLKALSRSSAASYRCSLVAKNLLRRRDRLEPARSQLRVRPSKYVFSSKIITRTSPRELWDRSDSFSRAHLALERGGPHRCCSSLYGSSFGILDRSIVRSIGAEASANLSAAITAIWSRASGQRLQKARESRLVFRRKTRDPGAAAPKRIADPAAPYTRTLPRQRVSPRNLWRKR